MRWTCNQEAQVFNSLLLGTGLASLIINHNNYCRLNVILA